MHKNPPITKKTGTLYVLASPIGNMNDITLRAIEVIKSADLILCEDTRITMKLLSFYKIKAPKLIHYNDLCSEKELNALIDKILCLSSSVLISNAGCPCFSDPGYRLISAAALCGLTISPIPGANAFTTAIMASGMNGKFGFMFCGFLPKQTIAKKNFFESLKTVQTVLVFFDRANKVSETLNHIEEIFNNPKVCVAREMTKIYESFYRGSANQVLLDFKQNKDNAKGEVTLLLDNTKEKKLDIIEYEEYIKYLLEKKLTTKEVTEKIKMISKISKKEIYDFVNKIKHKY